MIPQIIGKVTTHKMWTTFTSLCQSTNENRKMVLQERLNNICMNRYEIVSISR